MKLYIPEQTEPADDALPSHPRKVKKWLAAIPQANMGEMTRQIFNGLRQLNRQKMPNKHRLENMEMLRAPVREIFKTLEKYFINRTFPLPEKSNKIINLNQALLQEMAHGYKIIVYEAANKIDEKLDTKSQTISIGRAIRYQSELFLKASEVYSEVPPGTWYDMHQMYAYAESKGIQNNKINDSEHPASKTNIEDAYKQALLFSLARPTAMRQSDTARVFNRLYEWSSQAKLDKHPDESQVNRFFCTHIDDDRPASYLTQQDCESGKEIHTLETTQLVDTIREQINSSEKKQDELAIGDQISLETLKVLATSWGEMPKRRFSRAEKHGHIAAAIGLAPAANKIREENAPVEEDKSMPDPFGQEPDSFSLEHIPDEMKSMSDGSSSQGYLTHTEIGGAPSSGEAWDMVAKGNVMTGTYEREQQALEKDIRNKEDDDLHWEVVNISAGGYCLRWNSDNTSKAQIGELIALREQVPDGRLEWRIGVIRWMQFTKTNGLEIGVQVLSPKVVASEVLRLNRLHEVPFDSLMVPGIKPLKQPATILLPAHAFKTGDKLRVKVLEQTMDIQLGTRREHTGSFTQFQFGHVDAATKAEKIKKKKEASKNKDDFDEIWTSL
jgi:hypothetical protein